MIFKRGVLLVSLLLASLAGCEAAFAQTLATTTISDTIYRADGTPAGGSVVVTWSSFVTATGTSVTAGSTSATLSTGGVLTLALAPNAQATPMGSYYTAIFHLNDGTTSRQYWVVPSTIAGAAPIKLAAIQNQVLPTTVAMQTVSKQYVDNAIAAAQISPIPLDSSPYVLKGGDTMTGPLVLPGDPAAPLQAADKNYVDTSIAAVTGSSSQAVSRIPTATQVVAQPTGTELEVNRLNGELHAGQYTSGPGNNGIANALATSDCTSGCRVIADPTYGSAETVTAPELPAGTQVIDERSGAEVRTSSDPLAANAIVNTTVAITQQQSMSSAQLYAARSQAAPATGSTLSVNMNALAGGTNQYPEQYETPPYFKSTYGTLHLNGNYNTQGQHVQLVNDVNCYGVGDCIAGGQYITSSGGYRDSADEGTHPWDLSVTEDQHVFTGTCTTGCTAGSTSVTITGATNAGTQGDGRYLIDTNPARLITIGQLTGGSTTGILPSASFSGTSFPVSTFLQTAQAALSQPHDLAPGTVTLAIATTGVPSGFATNTAALPAGSGVACVADNLAILPNFEMANYTVVDATHLQLTLAKVHGSGAVLGFGGLCGYGIEQTVDTTNGIRSVFPVVGSTSATGLYYAGGYVPRLGISGHQSAYLNLSYGVATIARSGGVVTVTLTSNAGDVSGLALTVAGVADPSYNGTFTVTSTGANTLTYASAGANSTSSGGTLSLITGGFVLYPLAEVTSVYNPASRAVDGTFTLGPNTVAWATGDTVEQPHFYGIDVQADTEVITQYQPRPDNIGGAGKTFTGIAGPGLIGWQINNAVPASSYVGGGGNHGAPLSAYTSVGVWTNNLEAYAGLQSVFRVHCNMHACNRWDSGYSLFYLDAASGWDFINYAPQSSTTSFLMGGQSYSFSPTAFTANTINAATLNVTTLNASSFSGTAHLTGGSIDNTTLGATTPAAANVTRLGIGVSSVASGFLSDVEAATGNAEVKFAATTTSACDCNSGFQFYSSDGLSGFFASTAHAYNGSALLPNSQYLIDAGITPSSEVALVNTGTGSGNNVSIYTGGVNLRAWWDAAGTLHQGSAGQFTVNASGDVTAAAWIGPAAAPSGACSLTGAWVFSQDGHATFCNGTSWVTKL